MDEVSDLRLEDEDLLREAEGDTKRKKDAVALGQIKQQKEDEIQTERSLHLFSMSLGTHQLERFYLEDWNEVQQEKEEWQLPDEWQRILQMVLSSRDLEINPVGCGLSQILYSSPRGGCSEYTNSVRDIHLRRRRNLRP